MFWAIFFVVFKDPTYLRLLLLYCQVSYYLHTHISYYQNIITACYYISTFSYISYHIPINNLLLELWNTSYLC